jgi:quercetin dioxygenase-like cupin family protein
VQPGDRRISQPHRPGSLELLTVHAGTVELEVDDHRVAISAGDSAWFDATRPHAYSNPAATAASFTLVVLEPA